MMNRIAVLVLILGLLPGTVHGGESPSALCATPAQKEALAKAWTAQAPRLSAVARDAGVSEAAALSALTAERAVGVSGVAFADVWKSLQTWPDSVTVIAKADQVFEVHGRIPPGEPSKISKYFNLDPAATGITGHLRPDVYSAIYATSLPGRDRVEHGILFFDPAGQLIFGVYVPNEHAAEDSRVLEAFRATAATIGALPPLCPKE
jgi:putative heme iron utilization protein